MVPAINPEVDEPSTHALGLWELVHPPVYTAVFPAGKEPDPAVVRAIRQEFHPEFLPLWMAKHYRDPSGSYIDFGWYVLGRWAPIAGDPEKEPVNVCRPSLASFSF